MNKKFEVKVLTKSGGVKYRMVEAPWEQAARQFVEMTMRKGESILSIRPAS